MKTPVLLVCLFLYSCSAFADVTGSWIGWGSWHVDGQGPDCPTMKISFQEDGSELRRIGGVFDCGIVVLHSDPLRWTKEGNSLFLDGKAAGEANPNGFVALEPYDDEGTIVRTTFTREGRHADYEELWFGSDGKLLYEIRGRLFLQGN